MSNRTLQLSDIRLDGGTQCRAALDADHINSLAEAWTEGAKMPAVVVFFDGTNNWLADGFHRYHAAQKCDYKDVLAEVRSGTRTDAVKFALGANAAHGLRRTNADKRRAVEIALKEFGDEYKTTNAVAQVCGVSDELVRDVRRDQLPNIGSCAPKAMGRDGKLRPMKYSAREWEEMGKVEHAPADTRPPIGGSLEDIETPAAPLVRREDDASWAPQYASAAIEQLKKISRKDKRRKEALESVQIWIEKNK